MALSSVTSAQQPPTGIVRRYLDGTAGNDNNDGGAWVTAWATPSYAAERIAQIAQLSPTELDLVLYVRGAFTEDMVFTDELRGLSRFYIVHPRDQWTLTQTTTIAAIGGEAPVPEHDMERLTLANAVNATELGKTYEITDGVNSITGTIVRVDPNGPYVWTAQSRGDFASAAWIAASVPNTIFRVLEPSMRTDFAVVLKQNTTSPLTNPARAVYGPKCWIIGVRSPSIYTFGFDVHTCACYAATTAGAWGSITMGGAGSQASWLRQTFPGNPTALDDTLAQEFGLFAGTPTVPMNVGNGAGYGFVIGGAPWTTSFTGYYDIVLQAFDGGRIQGYNVNVATIVSAVGSYASAIGIISRGFANFYPDIYASSNSLIQVNNITHIDNGVPTNQALFYADEGGIVDVYGADFEVDPACAAANVPDYGAYANGGRIVFQSNVGENFKFRTTQFYVDRGGEIHVPSGTITMTTARQGVGPDFDIRHGQMIVIGGVTKTAVNTAASTCLAVGPHAKFYQFNGNFSLPAGTADWPTDYGATGAIWGRDGSEIKLDTVSGGGPATTGVGVYLKRRAGLIYFAGSLSGVAPLVVGALAAQPWVAALTVSDPTELCSLCLLAVP